MTPTRTVSLDAPTHCGGSYYELVADPDRLMVDDDEDTAASEDSVADARLLDGAATVLRAVADAREAETRAERADTEADRCRRESDAATRRAITLANALLESCGAQDLLQLSKGQLAIVETRIAPPSGARPIDRRCQGDR